MRVFCRCLCVALSSVAEQSASLVLSLFRVWPRVRTSCHNNTTTDGVEVIGERRTGERWAKTTTSRAISWLSACTVNRSMATTTTAAAAGACSTAAANARPCIHTIIIRVRLSSSRNTPTAAAASRSFVRSSVRVASLRGTDAIIAMMHARAKMCLRMYCTY